MVATTFSFFSKKQPRPNYLTSKSFNGTISPTELLGLLRSLEGLLPLNSVTLNTYTNGILNRSRSVTFTLSGSHLYVNDLGINIARVKQPIDLAISDHLISIHFEIGDSSVTLLINRGDGKDE